MRTATNRGPLGQETRCPMFALWAFSLEEEQWTAQLMTGLPDGDTLCN